MLEAVCVGLRPRQASVSLLKPYLSGFYDGGFQFYLKILPSLLKMSLSLWVNTGSSATPAKGTYCPFFGQLLVLNASVPLTVVAGGKMFSGHAPVHPYAAHAVSEMTRVNISHFFCTWNQ